MRSVNGEKEKLVRNEIGGKKRGLTWEGKRGIWKRDEIRTGIGSVKGFRSWHRYVQSSP